MAEIVLGMGTSHGPMLSTPPAKWDLRVPDDKRDIQHFRGQTWTFDELVEHRRDEHLERQITPEIWRERHQKCRNAIAFCFAFLLFFRIFTEKSHFLQ